MVAVELHWDDIDPKSKDNYEVLIANIAAIDTAGAGDDYIGFMYGADLARFTVIAHDAIVAPGQAFDLDVYGCNHDPSLTFADNRKFKLGATIPVVAENSNGAWYRGGWKYFLFVANHAGGATPAHVQFDFVGKLRE